MTEFTEKDFNEMLTDLNPDDSSDINDVIDAILKLIHKSDSYAGDNSFTRAANILVCALTKVILNAGYGKEYDEYFAKMTVSLLMTNLHQNRVLNSGDK